MTCLLLSRQVGYLLFLVLNNPLQVIDLTLQLLDLS